MQRRIVGGILEEAVTLHYFSALLSSLIEPTSAELSILSLAESFFLAVSHVQELRQKSGPTTPLIVKRDQAMLVDAGCTMPRHCAFICTANPGPGPSRPLTPRAEQPLGDEGFVKDPVKDKDCDSLCG